MSDPSMMLPAKTVAHKRRWFDSVTARVIAGVAAFTVAAVYEATHLVALGDNDVWSHLRTGLWILQNHTVPRSGLFSQSISLTWIDSSWGFDVLTASVYRLFGLAGLPILLLLFQVAVAIALFRLARNASGSLWPAMILGALAQCCIVPLQLRPSLCSAVLLSVELTLLLRSRRAGDARQLFWLPPIFLLWVNLDRQFSYGMVVLALFCLATIVEYLCSRSGRIWFETGLPAMDSAKLTLVTGASVLATFFSPYTYHLPASVWQSATDSLADRYFRELHAMRFRQPQDYLVMLLAMTAFFALGRRRSRDLFLVSLLVVSTVISFRLQRDAWLVVVASVAVIGNALRSNEVPESSGRHILGWELATGVATVLVLAAVSLHLPRTETLMSKISENFPVRASAYISQNHLPQPIFNTYQWGGFLTWYLPGYPVSIDGRADLYGDDVNIAYFKMIQAEIPLQSDPHFVRAQTILLEANSPIAEALSSLPGFRLAYKDDQAAVVVREH